MFYSLIKTEMKRDSFVWYASFSEAIKLLPEKDRLTAYDYLTNYWIYGKEPEEKDAITYAMFLMAKPQIDANNKRYIDWKKWGRPKKDWDNSKKPTSNQDETEPKPNVNENVDTEIELMETRKSLK